jgi:hypothetical protein
MKAGASDRSWSALPHLFLYSRQRGGQAIGKAAAAEVMLVPLNVEFVIFFEQLERTDFCWPA